MGMYEFLLMSGYTTIMSFGVDAINRLRTMKIIADKGYKLDEKKLSNAKKITKVIGNDKSLTLLFPFYNMALSLTSLAQCLVSKEAVMEKLESLEVVKEMIPEEIKDYQEKPSCLKALKINKTSNKKEKNGEFEIYKKFEGTDISPKDSSNVSRQKVSSIRNLDKSMIAKNNRKCVKRISNSVVRTNDGAKMIHSVRVRCK